MINFKKIIPIALVATVLISATGCKMIEKTEDAINRSPVAKVNGDKITRGELDSTLGPLFIQLEEKYGENYANNTDAKEIMYARRQQQIESVIMQKIIEQKAKELGVVLSEEEVTKKETEYIEKSKEEFESEEEYNKALEESKMTEEDLKREGRELAVREALYEKLVEDIVVTDESIKNYYTSNQEWFTEEPNEYKISHILVESKEEADKAKERIDSGEDFAEVAKEVSKDNESKEKGGDLGFLKYNSTKLSSTVFTAAKTLEIGALSDPIEDSTGVHIVKLEEKKEFPVKSFDDVKEDIEKSLRESQKQTKWQSSLMEWIQESNIKRYDNNLK